MTVQVLNLTVIAQTWEGSELIDPLLIDGGGVAYLRVIQIDTAQNAPRVQLSSAAGGPSIGAGPNFTAELIAFEEAFTFLSDNGNSLILPGPNHSGNPFPDSTEPYFWGTPPALGLGDWWVANIAGQSFTLTLDDGMRETTDGPWSAFASNPTLDGAWSNLLSPETQNSEWSNLLATPSLDGLWSNFVTNGTVDGPWSNLLDQQVGTRDGAWSNLLPTPTLDGAWSGLRISYPPGLTGLLMLATPAMPILEAIDQTAGSYEADIVWTGMVTHTELHQVRIRWITRANDRQTTPAPTRDVAMGWEDSESGMVEGDFRYIDTVVADPDAAILGPVLARDNPLMDTDFSNQPLWVMARLEVDEANKYGQPAAGTARPFYVSSERADHDDGGATRFTVYRGDEDAWCVGQMALQPSPSWLITYEVAGVLLTAPVDSFSWNVPDESIELVISSLVASTGFVVHSIRMESSGSPRWTRAWNTGQQLPDGSYGELVLTNRGATLTVDPVLHCP